MVSVQLGKSALTSEIFDDNPHQRNIPILQKFEGENPLHLTFVLRLNVRLIIMPLQITLFKQFSPTSRIPVATDILAVDKVKVIHARVTWLSWSLEMKSLVNSG